MSRDPTGWVGAAFVVLLSEPLGPVQVFGGMLIGAGILVARRQAPESTVA